MRRPEAGVNLGDTVSCLGEEFSVREIISPETLLDPGFVLNHGEEIVVIYHDDGGQMCVANVWISTDPARAYRFVQNCKNEVGHNCIDSVTVGIVDAGRYYLYRMNKQR